jgi:hypothetical protein
MFEQTTAKSAEARMSSLASTSSKSSFEFTPDQQQKTLVYNYANTSPAHVEFDCEELLDYFYDSLPPRPWCADDYTQGSQFIDKEKAVKMRHIQVNGPGLVRWLVLDVDNPHAFFAWDDANLPRPHIIVVNPANGHAHWLYRLEMPVCITDKGWIKPQKYLDAVREGFHRANVGVDPCYSGPLCKNPLSCHWKTYWHPTKPYDLDFLADHLDLPPRGQSSGKRRAVVEDLKGLVKPGTRNVTLFNLLRQQIYSHRFSEEWASGSRWDAHVLELAEQINASFDPPLPFGEVKSTAKSVAGWTWRRYRGHGGEPPDSESQRKAQQCQAKARSNATDVKIKEAVINLQERRERVTIVAIASLTGLSRDTVSRHQNALPRRLRKGKR